MSAPAPRAKDCFEDLHHHREIAALGFAEQQMNVLGHNHVANDYETVTAAHLFHDFEKQIAILWRAEQSASPIATGRDEVKVSGAVAPMEFCRHRPCLSQRFKCCL